MSYEWLACYSCQGWVCCGTSFSALFYSETHSYTLVLLSEFSHGVFLRTVWIPAVWPIGSREIGKQEVCL